MLRKLIRKKHFRTLLAQLRGAKILREKDTPFYVMDAVSSLTDVSLGLQKNDFPKVLVGSHGPIAEILLRQIFLKSYLISDMVLSVRQECHKDQFLLVLHYYHIRSHIQPENL